MANSAIPPYFSWVVDRLLAVSALPFHHTHLRYLTEHGIHTVVSITDETLPPFHTKPELKVIHLQIGRNGPSMQECEYFVSLVLNAKQRREVTNLTLLINFSNFFFQIKDFLKGILVHSTKGTGRAGVLVACVLVKLWECPADYVVDHLRVIRPISIETAEQEKRIHDYYKKIASNFQGYYERMQTVWDSKTEFLGKPLESFVDQPVSELYQQRIQEPPMSQI